MVFYSQQALRDFDDIFYGLLLWERVGLSKPFVESYIKELKTQYENIPNNSFHPDTTFSPHKKNDSKVHRFQRNSQTQWYIIYDIDAENNVYINKIISNYITE